MLKKLRQALISVELKVRNAIFKLKNEEKGGTEIVAILLIIIVLIGVVVIFRDQLSALISSFFTRISEDVKTDL